MLEGEVTEMLTNIDPSNFPMRLEGDCIDKNLLPISAKVIERISDTPSIEVDFYCANIDLPLEDIVGNSMHLLAESGDKRAQRWFRGTCISCEFVSLLDEGGLFRADVRPWLWMLTRRTDLRIFQDLTVVDIIKAVLGKYGFSGNIKLMLSHSYEAREYCVQYRETDFDFISRLMQEEGIYYYFDHTPSTEQMVLVDDMTKHLSISEPSIIKFRPYTLRSTRAIHEPFIYSWRAQQQIRSGKVVLEDYNFATSAATITSGSRTVRKKSYLDVNNEQYDYPGHFGTADLGEHRARIQIEAETVPEHTVTGVSDAINMSAGYLFEIAELPRTKDKLKSILLLECIHNLVQLEFFRDLDGKQKEDLIAQLGASINFEEPHRVNFVGMDANDAQYRAPFTTPWPKVAGVHTAVVVGPSGEEIYTDKYGRIRVQFHWDRTGVKDEYSSCWVRTMMPWTGKNWGMIAVPRIGQEVVINFEDGDPDRPVCIGMLYNDVMMPPYSLPSQKTQSGVKTNSSMGGNGFNELMFEDKKGEELVRFQAENDFKQIIKNNADIIIGKEKNKPGNMTLFVQNNQTETTVKNKTQTVGESYNLQIGNKTAHADMMSSASTLISQLRFGVSPSLAGALAMAYDALIGAAADNKFNETIEGAHGHVVTMDHSQLIGAKHDHTVLGKFAQTIGLNHEHLVGVDYSQEIKRNHIQTVDDDYIQTISGKNTKTVTKDMSTKVEQGDISIEAKLGQIEITAMKKIVLKVGKSSVEVSPTGINIKGPTVQINGQIQTEVKGGAALILKGGLTMIN